MTYDDKAWFVYTKVPGRLSAVPVSVEGWLVVLGLPALGLGAYLLLLPIVRRYPPLAVVTGLVVLALVLAAIFMLVLRKGRPAG